MRIAVAVAVALAVPVTAAADPVADAGNALATAVAAGDVAAVTALFAAKVKVDGLTFADAKCQKAFGRYKPHTVKGKQQARLAACLIHAAWAPKTLGHVADRTATYAGSDAELEVRFTVAEPRRIESIVSFMIGDAIGDDLGMFDGTGTPQAPHTSASPPPPPPRAPPSNVVAPTALEPLRLTGDKNIVPDATTKAAMVKAGKTKVVASFKMCLDTAGKVDLVKQLKSSGFGVYDIQLTAGIRSWTYQPYEVNGTAVPVCTAVTFVYTVK